MTHVRDSGSAHSRLHEHHCNLKRLSGEPALNLRRDHRQLHPENGTVAGRGARGQCSRQWQDPGPLLPARFVTLLKEMVGTRRLELLSSKVSILRGHPLKPFSSLAFLVFRNTQMPLEPPRFGDGLVTSSERSEIALCPSSPANRFTVAARKYLVRREPLARVSTRYECRATRRGCEVAHAEPQRG